MSEEDKAVSAPRSVSPHAPDLERLRRYTPARLRLDPEGGPAPLSAVLDFALCHAKARDAIHLPVDWDAVEAAMPEGARLRVRSQADSRDVYLRRPDLGRRLADADLARLCEMAGDPVDLAIIVGDGLSAHAINDSAGRLVAALSAALGDLRLAPIILAEQARVGLGDEIGAALGAPLVLVLIGERPGLSVTNSVGAYLTLNPKVGTPDSARNCVSNIHGNGGLSIEAATHKIVWLIRRAREIGATGVALKDMSDTPEALE